MICQAMSWVLVAKRKGGPFFKKTKFKEERKGHKHWKINDGEFQYKKQRSRLGREGMGHQERTSLRRRLLSYTWSHRTSEIQEGGKFNCQMFSRAQLR